MEKKFKLEISKTKLTWIVVIIIVCAVIIAFNVMMPGEVQNLEQATETMTEVGSGIGRVSSTLEDIASSLG